MEIILYPTKEIIYKPGMSQNAAFNLAIDILQARAELHHAEVLAMYTVSPCIYVELVGKNKVKYGMRA